MLLLPAVPKGQHTKTKKSDQVGIRRSQFELERKINSAGATKHQPKAYFRTVIAATKLIEPCNQQQAHESRKKASRKCRFTAYSVRDRHEPVVQGWFIATQAMIEMRNNIIPTLQHFPARLSIPGFVNNIDRSATQPQKQGRDDCDSGNAS